MAKNKTGSLDTNILLRLVLNDIPDQILAIKKLFEQSDVLHVADIVIFEIVFILDKYYEFSREDICESLQTIIRNNKINCNRRLFEMSLMDYSKNKKLSFVDSTLPYYAQLGGVTPLYTFDKALAQSSDIITLLSE